MKRIKPAVSKTIRDNDAIVYKIATSLHKRFRTVYQWLLSNDEFLTSPAVLSIIREETGLTDVEIIEEVEPEKKRAIA